MAAGEAVEFLPVIIRMESAANEQQLSDMGVVVWRTRDDLALCAVPVDILQEVIGSRWVRDISSSACMVPSMDRAAVSVGLDKVRNRIDLNGDYTGEGVVVGFSDIGFDPWHINFLDAAGAPRTKWLSHYDGFRGRSDACRSPEELEQWRTDNLQKYHATHVGGILAGSASGSPYNGVAQQAEIVATTSNLYDPEILAGVEDVIEYARSVGKPAVVNLSLSSEIGPHDGTQLFNEYIGKLGEEAIIVVSAGNAAENPVVVSKILTEDDPQLSTAFMDEWVWCGFNVNGAMDIWSDSSMPLEAELLILDDLKYSISSVIDVTADEFLIVSHEYADSYPTAIVSPEFDELYSGVVKVYKELNTLNNRYNVYVEVDYEARKQQTQRGWAESWIGIRVKGAPGTRVDGYASHTIHLSRKAPSLTPGTGVGSINDIATAPNIISVGAYSTGKTFTQLNGEQYEFPRFEPEEIVCFSSYGTLVDGRQLPTVSAPGAAVVSSVSNPYMENGGFFEPLVYKQEHDGKTYYWGAESGTSMASPLVAGGIALWLQADPSLKYDDIANILNETSPLPPDATHPGWGRGKFNLYAGLQMVRKAAGVENVIAPLNPVVTRDGNSLTVNLESDGVFRCAVSSVSGVEMISASGSNSVTLSLDALPRGVYLLAIYHNGSRHTVKILR